MRRPACLSSVVPFHHYPVQDGLRAVGDVLAKPVVRQHRPVQVRDGNVHMGGADVNRQHYAGGGVEGKARRRPAAA